MIQVMAGAIAAVHAADARAVADDPRPSQDAAGGLAWSLLDDPGRAFAAPVEFGDFAEPAAMVLPPSEVQGRIVLEFPAAESRLVPFRDDFKVAEDPKWQLQTLPPVEFEFVVTGRELVPARRGSLAGDHPYWEWVLQPGLASSDPRHEGLVRALIPFALMERNANCVHYGILALRFATGGGDVQSLWQVSSETCAYLKFDAWGRARGQFDATTLGDAPALRRAFETERSRRLPIRPITDLAARGVEASLFGHPDDVAPADLTAFGVVLDGVHYAGGCMTRAGPYPFCDGLPLPSYSLAKSLFAGLALARLEKLYPGAGATPVAELVPECREAGWDGVTIRDAIDMATGRFDQPGPNADEDAAIDSPLFLAEDHATRIRHACGRYPRRAEPGTVFAYHTSDTYVAVTAMSGLLRRHAGRSVDLYRDLVVADLWRPLGLSPLTLETRRTRDITAQPFGGWGLLFQRDDIARLGNWLVSPATNGPTQVLDEGQMDQASQQHMAGRAAGPAGLAYRGGFWSLDVAPYVGCARPVRVSFMAGYGGIVVAMFPNGVVYYHFADGGSERWAHAIRGVESIRPLCPDGNSAEAVRSKQ